MSTPLTEQEDERDCVYNDTHHQRHSTELHSELTPTSLSGEYNSGPSFAAKRRLLKSFSLQPAPRGFQQVEHPAELDHGLIGEVRSMQTLLHQSQDALMALQLEKAEHEQRAESLAKQLKQKTEATEHLKEDIWNLELTNQDLRQQIQELTENLTQAAAEHSRLMQLEAGATKELEQLRDAQQALQDAIEEMRQEHEQELLSLRKTIVTLKREKEQLQGRCATSQQTSGPTATAVPGGDHATIDRRREIQMETLERPLSHTQAMASRLEAQLAAERAERAEIDQLLHEAQEIIEGLQSTPHNVWSLPPPHMTPLSATPKGLSLGDELLQANSSAFFDETEALLSATSNRTQSNHPCSSLFETKRYSQCYSPSNSPSSGRSNSPTTNKPYTHPCHQSDSQSNSQENSQPSNTPVNKRNSHSDSLSSGETCAYHETRNQHYILSKSPSNSPSSVLDSNQHDCMAMSPSGDPSKSPPKSPFMSLYKSLSEGSSESASKSPTKSPSMTASKKQAKGPLKDLYVCTFESPTKESSNSLSDIFSKSLSKSPPKVFSKVSTEITCASPSKELAEDPTNDPPNGASDSPSKDPPKRPSSSLLNGDSYSPSPHQTNNQRGSPANCSSNGPINSPLKDSSNMQSFSISYSHTHTQPVVSPKIPPKSPFDNQPDHDSQPSNPSECHPTSPAEPTYQQPIQSNEEYGSMLVNPSSYFYQFDPKKADDSDQSSVRLSFEVGLTHIPTDLQLRPDHEHKSTKDAITRATIGDWMYKHKRKRVGHGISENKHERFVWLHPYTMTLYWSTREPRADQVEQRVKSAPMFSFALVPSEERNRPSFLIQSSTRHLKFQCKDTDMHRAWFKALHFLAGRNNLKSFDQSRISRILPLPGKIQSKSLFLNTAPPEPPKEADDLPNQEPPHITHQPRRSVSDQPILVHERPFYEFSFS